MFSHVMTTSPSPASHSHVVDVDEDLFCQATVDKIRTGSRNVNLASDQLTPPTSNDIVVNMVDNSSTTSSSCSPVETWLGNDVDCDLSNILGNCCSVADVFGSFSENILFATSSEGEEEPHETGGHVIVVPQKDQQNLTEINSTEVKRDPKTKLFLCAHCPKSFQYGSRLQRHLTTHQSKQFPCKVCDKYFSRRDVMEAHVIRVHRSNRLSSASSSSSEDSDHSANVGRKPSSSTTLPCPQCPALLSTRHHLDRHMSAHAANFGTFSCTYCSKTFTGKHKYQVHMRQHLGERKFKCSECGQAFLQREFLRRHEMTHSREAPFICFDCGRTFRQQVNLKQHKLRKHGGKADNKANNSKHVCSQCPKKFLTSSELKNHMLYHGETVRAFSCSTCESAFVEKRHLDRHIRRVHTGIRNYFCNSCGKAFYEKYELNYHLKVSNVCNTQT